MKKSLFDCNTREEMRELMRQREAEFEKEWNAKSEAERQEITDRVNRNVNYLLKHQFNAGAG